MLLVACSDAGDADEQERGDLAVHKIAVVVYHPPFNAPVNISQYSAPVVEHGRVDDILEEL